LPEQYISCYHAFITLITGSDNLYKPQGINIVKGAHMKRTLLLPAAYIAAALILGALFSGEARADVRLPSVIGSNMVLQRDTPVPLWGWASPGERVTVETGSFHKSVTAGRDSTWSATLDPMSAGGPIEIVIRGGNTLRLTNVMIGEVWVSSGQSNMEMRLCHVQNAPMEVAEALHRDIRLFQTTNDLSPDPQRDCEGRWEVCRPSTAYLFSAAAYFFGRELARTLGVPVGLINSSWGGTTAETWMRTGALASNPALKPILDYWDPILRTKSPELLAYHRITREWEEDVHFVLYAGKPILPQYAEPPKLPVPVSFAPSVPAWVYNAMIAPIVPFAIRGVIWYQGESNSGRAYQYRKLFPAIIRDWRNAWGRGDFPFLFVQLPNFGGSASEPGESIWAELREAQLMTLSLPNTGMAVAVDIGDSVNIHPRNKQEVGRRLALAALGVAYGKSIEYSGPIYRSMAARDGRIHLNFDHIGSGLSTSDGGSPKGFAVAGTDGVYRWADASIDGNEVVVWSQSVPAPLTVRYGWADNPVCTLMNREGLPASPFRTDNRPDITVGK
jgi:sialate O-acetylesterase